MPLLSGGHLISAEGTACFVRSTLAGTGQGAVKRPAGHSKRVQVSTLALATTLDEEALFQALEELEWQRWLTADPRGYSFVARIVRDVIARDMLTAGQTERLRQKAQG